MRDDDWGSTQMGVKVLGSILMNSWKDLQLVMMISYPCRKPSASCFQEVYKKSSSDCGSSKYNLPWWLVTVYPGPRVLIYKTMISIRRRRGLGPPARHR